MTLKDVWHIWRRFWFEPTSPLPVCIYRILLGLLILESTIIHNLPCAIFWYGPKGIIPIADVEKHFWLDTPKLDALLLFPPTDQSVYLFFYLFIAFAVMMTIGLFTRQSVIMVAVGLISLHHHQPFNINGGDTMMRIATILLCFCDCGRLWSVDSLIRRLRGKPLKTELTNPWGQRLIQVQLAIAYWQTFCCKIVGPQWLDGTAVYYATRLDDMLKLNPPFLDSLLVCKFLTWYTLVIELFLWTLIWFKECRYWILLGAFCLHFGIETTINLPVFEWVFMATLVLFIEPDDLKKCINFVALVIQGKVDLFKSIKSLRRIPTAEYE
ncbi:MAG: HTTM domain-containing protein [Candidatus Obscuribacterales bacterium]|nr:HTTM domain-containing protein [Candidatus Obscuribacterales bacterium]